MRAMTVPLLVPLLVCFALASTNADAEGLEPLTATTDQSTVYAMGLLHAHELRGLNLSDAELELYREGLRDGLAGGAKLTLNDWLGAALTAIRGREQARVVEERRASEKFLEFAAAEPGARRLASGLIYTELERGRGPRPGPDSVVTLHYHGTVRDGTVVESSVSREEPVRTALSNTLPCWQQGLRLLGAGGRAKLVCPAALAYGNEPPTPVIAPGAVVTYEIELRGVQ